MSNFKHMILIIIKIIDTTDNYIKIVDLEKYWRTLSFLKVINFTLYFKTDFFLLFCLYFVAV